MNKVSVTVPIRKKASDGKDGTNGQGCFKSIVFKRSSSLPNAPSSSEGSYYNPVPTSSGWSDGIPAENGNPCYMCTRLFTSDGQYPQQSAWTAPRLISDTADFDVCFSSQTNRPSAPTTHGTQNDSVWHETGTENDIWMATCKKSNGIWGAWSISKIKGEDGTSVSIKGQAIAHFANNAAFQAGKSGYGFYILDNVSGISGGSGAGYLRYTSSSVSAWQSEEGDGWIVNGHLFICTDNAWIDGGLIQGPQGEPGDNAKYVVVNGEQIFSYGNDFTSGPTPSSITLSSKLFGGLTDRQWSYKKAGDAAYSDIAGATGENLIVSATDSAYWGSNNSILNCTFRCASNGYSDEITIAKVTSGKNGDGAITIVLSNESHTFAGENGYATAATVDCSVIVYKGNTRIASAISISGAVTGMTAAIKNNGTVNTSFQVSVNTSLTQKSGTLTITVTADGKTFVKLFSWALSLKGNTGTGSEGRSAFDISVTPLVLSTDDTGSVRYNDGGAPTNMAYITATYKGSTAMVSFQAISQTYKCSAAQSTYNINGSNQSTTVGVAITNVSTKHFKSDGTEVSNDADADYHIPATTGYAVVKCQFTMVVGSNTISETLYVTVPWTVNVEAHFSKFYHDNRVFESSITELRSDVAGDIANHTSLINQNASRISTLVSTTNNHGTRISAIEQTDSQISLKVDTLTEGLGRNLLQNTNQGSKGWTLGKNSGVGAALVVPADGSGSIVLGVSNPPSSSGWCVLLFDIPLNVLTSMKGGEKYVVSFDMVCSRTGQALSVDIMQTNGANALAEHETLIYTTDRLQRVHTVLEVQNLSSGVDLSAHRLYFSGPVMKTVMTLTISNLKLEKGTEPTAYAPAPEDYTNREEEKLRATGIDITNRKIQLTADNVEFNDNQGNFAALINGEGVTARSFIALNSMGVKLSSLNESGDGALIQYHTDGVTPKFRFGNDGITCYWGDESDRPSGKNKGDIRWFIGTGGVNGSTDDWIEYDKYEVTSEQLGLISTTSQKKWLFRAGSASANKQYDGLYYASNNLNAAKLDGLWANSTNYNMIPIEVGSTAIYFTRQGTTTRYRVCYIRNYVKYINGKASSPFAFFYDATKTCVGNSNPNSPYYGTVAP